MDARNKKKIIARANIYCSLIPKGFNDKNRKKVKDIEAYILENYGMDMDAIDAHDIANLLPTIRIRDEKVVRYVERYIYCKYEFPSVPPYEGGYDRQPTEWIDMAQEIKTCIYNLQELKGQMSGGQIRKTNRAEGKRRK